MPKSRILTKSVSAPRVTSVDVVGLEIAVDDAARVRGREPVAICLPMWQMRSTGRRAAPRRRAGSGSCPSRNSITKYVEPSGRSPKSEMSTMCGLPMRDAAFASWRKRSRISRSLREVGAQHLDRDLLVDDLVAGEVDDAHAALAEELLDLVAVVEGRADVRVAGVGRALLRRRHVGGRRDVERRLRIAALHRRARSGASSGSERRGTDCSIFACAASSGVACRGSAAGIGVAGALPSTIAGAGGAAKISGAGTGAGSAVADAGAAGAPPPEPASTSRRAAPSRAARPSCSAGAAPWEAWARRPQA